MNRTRRPRIIPDFQPSPRFDRPLREGYGVRRLAREEKKAPLIAMMGGLPSAEDYEDQVRRVNEYRRTTLRQSEARAWYRARAGLRSLTDEEYEAWLDWWDLARNSHHAAYALDFLRAVKAGLRTFASSRRTGGKR
jgi:hypothetical protein